ncbi:MAG TPA: hypothetical protein VF384_04760 [Planctomycetota bacterium]
MARSRRKNGGPTRGRFKLKKLGKGYTKNRAVPIGSRPVLRITETAGAGTTAGATGADTGSDSPGRAKEKAALAKAKADKS